MALLERCIENQIQVLAICHKGSKRIGQIPRSPYVTVLEADLCDYYDLKPEKTGGYDVFFHFAWNGTTGEARNNMQLQTHNIEYTVAAVELAQRLGCHTFVGAGSQAEYGRVEGKLRPDTPVYPENGYGMAKLCAGQMSRVLCEKKGMLHIWARILSVYGPYDGNSMITVAIRQFMAGEKTAFTPGEQLWDYLYSKDAARMLYELGEKGKHGSVYCIGSGKAMLLKEYIYEIYRAVWEFKYGKRLSDNAVTDEVLGIGQIPYAEKQVMFLCADLTPLEEHIGTVACTGFKEGIAETIRRMYA